MDSSSGIFDGAQSSTPASTISLNRSHQPVSDDPSCYVHFFTSEYSLVFFLFFLTCICASVASNGFIMFVSVWCKQLLCQVGREYCLMLRQMVAISIGLALLVGLFVFLSITSDQSHIALGLCVVEFSALRCLFLASEMTLTLLIAERYVFICHGIYYFRIMSLRNVCCCICLIWLISGATSVHGGMVLKRNLSALPRQKGVLLCDIVSIKRFTAFTEDQSNLMFVPPSVILALCVIVILLCYCLIYCAASRVSAEIHRSNRRANRVLSSYLFMFLLQLALHAAFIVLSLEGHSEAASQSCVSFTTVLPLLLIVAPTCIRAMLLLMSNPQLKQVVMAACSQQQHVSVEMVRA